ncbi:MAG: hypothetical protein ABI632_01915 [Pseudolysinimonas sp.]
MFALMFGGTVVLGSAGSACPPDACAVSSDQIALAQELMAAQQQGRLRFLETRYEQQVADVAAGKAVPHCGLDVRVLQVMVIAVRSFESVGISDLNRLCTGSLPPNSAGTSSSHWREVGVAVDLYAFDGNATTGADNNAVRLISMLDPIVPAGSRVGQSDCRAEAGTSLNLAHFAQFPDTCNHVHIDFAYTDQPLLIGK